MTMTPERTGAQAFVLAAAFVAAVSLMPSASALDQLPEPLPPPPELLEGMDLGLTPEPMSPAEQAEQSRRTAAAPAGGRQTSRAIAQPVNLASAGTEPTTQAARRPVQTRADSGQSGAEYTDLQASGGGIPGVLTPELKREYAAARPRTQGMSARQLAPFFSLAKGSEGAALEASGTGDTSAYRQRLENAINAYMEIVSMADAGTEAREEAWYGVGRCEYRLGNWWKAFDALERSYPARYDPREVEARVKLEMFVGERLWQMGDAPAPDADLAGYQAASRVYRAVLFNQPRSDNAPLALLRQGDAAARDKDWDEAGKYYRQLVETYPDSDEAMRARSSLAETIYSKEWPTGMPEEAIKDVKMLMDDVYRTEDSLSPEAVERRSKAEAAVDGADAAMKLRQAKEYLAKMRTKKSRQGAAFLLSDIVSKYPNTPQAEEAKAILDSIGVRPLDTASKGTASSALTAESRYGEEGDSGVNYGFGASDAIPPMVELEPTSGLPPSPTRETVYGQPMGTNAP